MQKPFSELASLWIELREVTAPIILDSFLGGSTPLQLFRLNRIPFYLHFRNYCQFWAFLYSSSVTGYPQDLHSSAVLCTIAPLRRDVPSHHW